MALAAGRVPLTVGGEGGAAGIGAGVCWNIRERLRDGIRGELGVGCVCRSVGGTGPGIDPGGAKRNGFNCVMVESRRGARDGVRGGVTIC